MCHWFDIVVDIDPLLIKPLERTAQGFKETWTCFRALEQRLQVLRMREDRLSRAVEVLLTLGSLCPVLLLNCALFFFEHSWRLFSSD